MLDMELEEEVFNDFKESLKAINFKHLRPTSPEFITAMNVGTMWRLVHKCNKHEMEIMAMNGSMKETHTEDMYTEPGINMDVEIAEIKNKLNQVENLYARFVTTGKDHYHQFAMEELHQAELMIKDAGSKMSESEYKDKMSCYEDWYISLHHKLNDVK